MKKVEAVIRHIKLDEVKAALDAVGVQGLTVLEVKGAGKQKGYTETWRGSTRQIMLRPKLLLSVVVPDDMVGAVVDAIRANAHTGEIGDGKIFITSVDDVIGIRTGITGDAALV